MKVTRLVMVLTLVALSLVSFGGSIPKGMEPIFDKVEPGKKFHPLWPPISGQQVLGTVVVARSPDKPQAFFQTINSPSYRNPTYTKDFIVGQLPFSAADLTQERNVDVGVGFAELDGIAAALKNGAQAANLVGNAPQAAPASTQPSSTNEKKGGSTTQPEKKDDSKKDDAKKDDAKKSTPSTNKITGVDFQKFSSATVKATGLKVIYYDLPTILAIEKEHALTPGAEQILSQAQKGWIIHRALVVDSLEYSFTSNSTIDAGFFAKLVAWIPTVSTTFKNSKTVTLKTTSPLTIGYKLWRPGVGPEGLATASTKVDALGVDITGIDRILKGLEPQ